MDAQHPLPRMVTVTAPARLHLGFLDPDASLGRRFGSVGLALEQPATRVRFQPAARLSVEGGSGVQRAERAARRLLEALGLPGAHLVVEEAIPEHAGLGSGTQMDLAVGAGLARLAGARLGPEALVRLAARGARSGIGIAAFQHGGFLVDGGRGETPRAPPLLARHPFPAAWRFILVFDARGQGLHGRAEKDAFARLPPFGETRAAALCHLLLMRALPALLEQDIGAFGQALTRLQEEVGDHFAPAQGGRYAHPGVAQALDWLARHGAAGVGQSSWGPTGFALLPSSESAASLLAGLSAAFADRPDLRFGVTAGRNHGARIDDAPD